jgi:predicted TIM-barrel fold metal-dependent hydrolase
MAMAGWHEYYPGFPPTYREMDPGAYDAAPRLARLDEYGVYAQVLFPNILGFSTHALLALAKENFAASVACVRAYNDFLVEFASADPARLIPIMCLPFWDIEASLAEMHRAQALGHRGIVFGSEFERVGLPRLADAHWDPVLAAAQDRGLSINFHTGFSMMSETTMTELTAAPTYDSASYAKQTALYHVGNINAIATIIMDGVCAKFPDLPFVSVESGFGYLPFLLEELDWQWHNSGAGSERPAEPLPSAVFRRQVYGAMWHERDANALLGQLADNIMFETDFPHPTSLSPGPATIARSARETVIDTFADLPDEVVQKVLWANAARLFHVDEPGPVAS